MDTTVKYRRTRAFEVILIAVALGTFAIAGIAVSHGALSYDSSGGSGNNLSLGAAADNTTIISYVTLNHNYTTTSTVSGVNHTVTITSYVTNTTTLTNTTRITTTLVVVKTTTVVSNSTDYILGTTTETVTTTVTTTVTPIQTTTATTSSST